MNMHDAGGSARTGQGRGAELGHVGGAGDEHGLAVRQDSGDHPLPFGHLSLLGLQHAARTDERGARLRDRLEALERDLHATLACLNFKIVRE